MDGCVDEQSRSGRAGLADILQDRLGDEVGRSGQVGVGEDDLRGFAAQLQHDRNHAVGGRVGDLRADPGGSHEPDGVHPGMRGQRGTSLGADAGHHVDDAGRQAHLGHEACEFHCGARCFIGRFDHYGVARGDGRRHRPGEQLHGVVPRDDVSRDAERLPPGVDVQVLAQRNGLAVIAVDGVGVEPEIPCGHDDVGASLAQGLAGVLTLQQRQSFPMTVDHIGDRAECVGSLSGSRFPPPRECLPRGGDCPVDLVGATACHRTDGPARGGIDVVVLLGRRHRHTTDERFGHRGRTPSRNSRT